MSGILYPILILTLFLIVQILMMMASRKAVLDKNKQQLLDSVNASNKIYTNEELSILFAEQKELIESQKEKITSLESTVVSLSKNVADNKKKTDDFQTKQENRNKQVPIGTYDLFVGDFETNQTTYQHFGTSYYPSTAMLNTLGWSPSKQVKICFVGSTTARGASNNTYSYTKIKMGNKELEMVWTTWGSTETGTSLTNCTDVSNSIIDTVNNPHWNFYAKTNNGSGPIRIYRVYLLVYEA